MPETVNGKLGSAGRLLKMALRVAIVMCLAFSIGYILNGLSSSLETSSKPAGFGRGVLQGALMPMSLPNLLLGKDVTIYSANNTGVPYKLGYTSGVNVCGLLFFGWFFWRVSRWRKRDRSTATNFGSSWDRR